MVVDHSALDDYFILERVGYILIREHVLFSVVCYLYMLQDWPFIVPIELSTVWILYW